MTWQENLRPASFRGVPFASLGTDGAFGRRTQIHEYPYRDTVWAEDLGRSARSFRVTGFLLEDSRVYGGGDVLSQRDRLIGVSEAPGDATLVHPTFGRMTVALLSLSYREVWDRGRYIEFSLELVEAGQRVFPSVTVSTPDQAIAAAEIVDTAAADAWVARATGPLALGGSVGDLVSSVTANFASYLEDRGVSVTSLFGLSSLLPGEFGRYWGGRSVTTRRDLRVGILGAVKTVGDLARLAAGARSDIGLANTVLQGAADGLGLTNLLDFARAAQSAVGSVLSSVGNSRDGVRAMGATADFTSSVPTTDSAIGRGRATIQSATVDVFRRSALTNMARASAAWEPPSFDEAVEVRTELVTRLDAEIVTAADQEEDEVFVELKALRAAVVSDLTARAANLARYRTVKTAAPMPSLALAYRLYQDIDRADELEDAAGSPHPAFLATELRALSA